MNLLTIYSIGHGAQPLAQFLETLREGGIGTLADVRTAPRSRKHPHFDGAALAASLRDAGIDYVHLKGLGGWRRADPSSPHAALRSPGFRGYADHLSSAEFARYYAILQEHARSRPTAYMCAETMWWRCHRRILSDRLFADDWSVLHLLRPGESEPHRLAKEARIVGGRLLYDVLA